MPATLREATDCLRASEMLREAFGNGVIDHYIHAPEWEQFEYDRRVTDWELKRGFERAWQAAKLILRFSLYGRTASRSRSPKAPQGGRIEKPGLGVEVDEERLMRAHWRRDGQFRIVRARRSMAD